MRGTVIICAVVFVSLLLISEVTAGADETMTYQYTTNGQTHHFTVVWQQGIPPWFKNDANDGMARALQLSDGVDTVNAVYFIHKDM